MHNSKTDNTSTGPGGLLDPALLSACIHCGLCLPACPTYLATGRETESPRGRIHLMTLLQKGEISADAHFNEHIDSCLGCLGCQSACPSGVRYGELLDQVRPALAANRKPSVRKFMRYIFEKVLPDYPKLRRLGYMLRLWQEKKGEKLFAIAGIGKLFGRLVEWQSMLPALPEFKALPTKSWISGEKSGQVQLFAGCVMDIFYNHINHACIRLLTAQRQVVSVPDQTCCGALAFHAGETDIAKRLAKRNIDLLEGTTGDIIVTAAGCGAMLKEYGHLLRDDDQWGERAANFSQRVKDITEFLADHQFANPPAKLDMKIAYHAACHLSHAQGVRSQPARLLEQLDGVQLIPLEEAEHCCGSAGIYNLTHTEISGAVLERKMSYLKETGADVVVTTNPGCLLQLDNGIRAEGLPMKACHIAEILDQAYCQSDEEPSS